MKKSLVVLASLLALFLATTTVRAQQVTAALTGTVTDTSGAVVPGTSITIHNNSTGADVRTVTTDATGAYTAPQLPYGTYTVTFDAKGFKKYVASDVVLHVGDLRTLNVILEVGAVATEVTVTATSVPVQTSSSAQQSTITGHQILNLQLNNRNFEQLLTLQPGVSSNLPDQIGFGSIANTDNIMVNGARGSANNWTVDGADINDSGSNYTLLNIPSVDALAEFTLARSTYDAQYGRSGGGQVNVVIKSGTSAFHGGLYEFFRNDVLNATPFLTNSSHGTKPVFRYNDYGFNLGGPIYIPNHYNTNKSKTFFFWSEEWRKTRTPTSSTGTLPSPAMMAGTFSATGTSAPPAAPVAMAPAGCVTNTVVGNTTTSQINPTCFSANAVVFMNQIYKQFTPNLSGNRVYTSLSAVNDFRQDLVRLDQKITDRIQFFGHWMNDQVPTTEPGGLWYGNPLPGLSGTSTNAPGRNIVTHATIQISSNIVNEVAFNYSWGAITSSPDGLYASPSLYGALSLGDYPYTDPYGRVPAFSITGVTGMGGGNAPYHERNVDKQVYDNLSIVKGNHTLRMGISNQWMRKSENGPTGTNGSFGFLNAFGNPAFANFLLGYASTFTQANHDVIPELRFINLGTFFQDDWKVKPNFTLNLGIRYDYMQTPHDVNGILTNFDPTMYSRASAPQMDPTTGRFVAGQGVTPANYLNGIIVGGQNSPYGAEVNPNQTTNISPRFGFSWDPFKTGKTAVRAGYGIYYDRTLNGIWEQNQFTNPPVVASTSLTNTGSTTVMPTNLLDNPSGGTAPTSILAPRGLVASGSPNFKTPYYQAWNFSVQREVVKDTMVEVAYVGGKGTHLLGQVDFNQVPVSVLLANPDAKRDALRPYPGWAAIRSRVTGFDSNYNSLQISANRRMARGLTFGLAYTWSKTMTNSTSDRNAADMVYNTYNWALDYGPSTFNQPQVFVFNYIYELPMYRGQQGLVGHVLGGWQISGITTFATGNPLFIRQSSDPFDTVGTSGTGVGIDATSIQPRPDLIGNPNGPQTVSQWFNTSAFKVASGHFGTAGRGLVLGPGRNNWDFSLFKNTKIGERITTQFRAEFFNAFNHTQFSGVGNNINTASTFGRITSTHDPRVIQLGLKLMF